MPMQISLDDFLGSLELTDLQSTLAENGIDSKNFAGLTIEDLEEMQISADKARSFLWGLENLPALHEWLSGIGLQQYLSNFANQQVTVAQALTLDKDDLKELGVAVLGHRKTMMENLPTVETFQGSVDVNGTSQDGSVGKVLKAKVPPRDILERQARLDEFEAIKSLIPRYAKPLSVRKSLNGWFALLASLALGIILYLRWDGLDVDSNDEVLFWAGVLIFFLAVTIALVLGLQGITIGPDYQRVKKAVEAVGFTDYGDSAAADRYLAQEREEIDEELAKLTRLR